MKYLAVDKDGFMGIYDERPTRNKISEEWEDGYYNRIANMSEIGLYGHLTWEDEPVELI